MTPDQIKQLIENGLPESTATVTGAEGKYDATVVSPVFEGQTMVKEHQMVYATVRDQIASGELHALSIKAYTPEEWDEKNAAS